MVELIKIVGEGYALTAQLIRGVWRMGLRLEMCVSLG